MNITLTGSIAYDYLMTFPGTFQEHILPDRLDRLSLSFLVDSLVRRRGGIAANIAYTLALLGERAQIMATVGEDFEEYRAWLENHGVDTSGIRVIEGVLTASFFVTTDQQNAQIASFFTGAMAHAHRLSFRELTALPDLSMISPNDPGAMVSYVRECIELGVPYIYDPSQQILRLSTEELEEGINGCLGLFCNDYEFGLIEEKTDFTLDNVRETADFIVVTLGERGAEIYTKEEEITIPSVPPARIVDPTGVGDAFRGGFLKGFAHELPLQVCGRMGALAATYCIEADGPQGHTFDLATFQSRFRDQFQDGTALDLLP
jgi:adenosine kinase